MWNDEDNNPYSAGFERRDSTEPASPSSQHGYGGPRTPSTVSDEPQQHPGAGDSSPQRYDDTSDGESSEEYTPQQGQPRKSGPYDSRIEQILYQNPDLPIIIVDAGKSAESGGKYIVYTIRTGDLEVRRRYSEFSSLRDALTRLHPTLIIPPIPEKHTMADYAANPTKAKQDQQIIDLRKRMLAVFLNRCRRMPDVLADGVWWRFLDPNSSWSEVLHSHPISSIPKATLKSPPLDPANPSPAHAFLPIPAASSKLKSASTSATNAQGMPNQPTEYMASPSAAAHTVPGPQHFGRFPPDTQNLSEQDLDPYFINFEAASKELEILLTGPMEKVNRRTLTHLSSLSTDLAELGARFNGFSLSEPSQTLAAAIERIGQAADSSYLATEELSGTLGASFAEPMRESAQFAGVVRNVLRYRVLKRVQQEMTNDELIKKKQLLESLERSESEAKRIDQYLSHSGSANVPRRSTSSARDSPYSRRDNPQEDTASIDSDFPPTHAEVPSATQGAPQEETSPQHRKSASGNFITNKIFGRISHAVHGVVDVDPERTRRDQIGKTRESIDHLQQAQKASEQDVKDASAGILKDLKRFQSEKEDDLRRYMLAYAKSQIEWAKKNKETWEEARSEVNKIVEDDRV
ncbi:Sorting nexin-41 [Phlyctema vagabunda]|uniref:Sorting nexin-41 n=1 Tax=Phlyctema vagabunda TaxID=108571 RepID=A0ABR4P293_9HELO